MTLNKARKQARADFKRTGLGQAVIETEKKDDLGRPDYATMTLASAKANNLKCVFVVKNPFRE